MLPYLNWLGVGGIWLSPSMPSPDRDWGYDVADYKGVHPSIGTMEELERFISTAAELGIHVLLDLVPNHTSDQHAWFIESKGNPKSKYRDYYVWAKGKGPNQPPNNWIDATGSSAWTFDEASGEYYLHNFLKSQPDLNWWNPQIHREMDEIVQFWFAKGVAGFRIDVAHGLYKDKDLRDDPIAPPEDTVNERFNLIEKYSKNQPEVHDVYRRWRNLAESYSPPRLLLGETWVDGLEGLAKFYGKNDELQMAFNFLFTFSKFDASSLRKSIAETLRHLPEGSTPVWTASNHDISRFPTRWAKGDAKKIRVALTILATLPGTLVIYYGDELGFGDEAVPPKMMRDEMTAGIPGTRFERDSARLPMSWNSSANRGFSDGDSAPWLPYRANDYQDVASQMANRNSILHYARELFALRKTAYDFRREHFALLESPPDVLYYRTGRSYVASNLSDATIIAHCDPNSIVLHSLDNTSWEVQSDTIQLAGWESVISTQELRFTF